MVVCLANIGLAFAVGPVAAAPSTDGWGLATRLEPSDVGLAYNIRSATGGDGVAIYTWTQTEGGVDLIHARLYDVVHGWGETTIIQTDTSAFGDSSFPVMDSDGNAVVVWIHFGTENQAWAARYDARLGWSPAETIGELNPGIGVIRAAIDGSGNVFAVWQQSDGFKNDIWANRYLLGTGWGAAGRIESADGGAVQPWIAADAVGNAIAVWVQFDAGIRSVFANRFTTGAWGTPSLIEADDSGNISRAFVSLAPDGRAVASWSISDGTRWNSWSAFYAPGAGWGTPVRVELDDTSDTNTTALSIDASGNATVAYVGCAVTCTAWASRSAGSASWGAPVNLSGPGTEWTGNARIGSNARGDVAIISFQQIGSRYDAWATIYTPSGGWGAPAPIETDNTVSPSSPWIAVDEGGNAYAAWHDYNGTASSVWANVYRALVPPDTSTQDQIAALEAQLRTAREDLNATRSQLEDGQDELAALRVDQTRTHNDLANSTGTVAALSGQVLALSILATVGVLAALGAIGLTMVQAARSKNEEDKPPK